MLLDKIGKQASVMKDVQTSTQIYNHASPAKDPNLKKTAELLTGCKIMVPNKLSEMQGNGDKYQKREKIQEKK